VIVHAGSASSAATAASKYSFGEPQVLSVSPAGGPVGGGTIVTITGTGFRGVTSVKFGAVSAVFTVDSFTRITATAPDIDSAGSVEVTVTNPAGTNPVPGTTDNDYTYGKPVITEISPAAGLAAGGTTVTIKGTGFGTSPTVDFGGATATVLTSSTTQITATAPSGFASGDTKYVHVHNGSLVSAETALCQYSYGPPQITLLTDNGGSTSGGETVLITGKGFTGVTSVKFGATSLISSNYHIDSPTQITVTSAPAGTGTVQVTVTTPGGTSAIDTTFGSKTKYSYGLPIVASLSPQAGISGTGVVITGSNLSGVEAVTFGGVPATFIVVNSDTQLTVQAPGGGPHPWPVVVTNGYGNSLVSSIGQYYSYHEPTVTGLSPAYGPVSSGQSVVITGTNFAGATSVMFGATSATFVVNTPTQITAVAPAAPGGTAGQHVTVKVSNAVGESTVTQEYAYGIATVASITPAAGHVDGTGETVVITGTNFVNVPASNGVGFYDAAADFYYYATAYTVNSATQITITGVPNGPDYSTLDVRVMNGTSIWSAMSSADEYSFGIPKITNLSPSSGSSGTTVTITGVCFTGVTSVTFGGVSTSYTVNSPTSITATAPSGLTGSKEVKVTNAEGTSTVTLFFSY
jgi:hypothetical protein